MPKIYHNRFYNYIVAMTFDVVWAFVIYIFLLHEKCVLSLVVKKLCTHLLLKGVIYEGHVGLSIIIIFCFSKLGFIPINMFW